jgi:two-component system, cell cycle sensor histidine kinase and response regulator CckA
MLAVLLPLAAVAAVYFAVEWRFRKRQAQLLSVLEATLESIGDGVVMVNRQGRMVEFNRRLVEMWRLPEGIVRSRDGFQALAWALEQVKRPETILAHLKELSARPGSETRDVVELKDGRTFEGASRPQTERGAVVGQVCSFRDITNERQLEESLRQAQRMEAIGRLSGGIAHDLNNLLMVVKGYGGLLAERLGPETALRKQAEEIGRATDRAAALTRELLSFSRSRPAKCEWVELNAVVRESEKLLGRLAGARIELGMKLDPAVGCICIGRSRLDQLLLNLAINARDAMPQGGRLIIETSRAGIEGRAGQTPLEASPGGQAMLVVSDTGVGMDAETQAHLFEPFYTTKKGRGTGLGLATVYAIVAESNGQIFVESAPERGTTFRICFPQACAPAQEPAAEPIPAELGRYCRGSETVLLAENEEGVRRLVAEFLRERGYVVLEAGGGDEAVDLGARYAGAIDLLLANVTLAGIAGPELAARLRRLRPNLRVVYMSGYPAAAIEGAGSAGREAFFLEKPFEMATLGRKVREALGQPRGNAKSAGSS